MSSAKWQPFCLGLNVLRWCPCPILWGWHSKSVVNEISDLAIFCVLTHCGRVTHICIGKLTIIGSDNGLSPGLRQAIIRTNAGILLIVPLGTNFSEIVIGIKKISFTEMRLKMSSAKFCLGLNVLIKLDCKPCLALYLGFTIFPSSSSQWKVNIILASVYHPPCRSIVIPSPCKFPGNNECSLLWYLRVLLLPWSIRWTLNIFP